MPVSGFGAEAPALFDAALAAGFRAGVFLAADFFAIGFFAAFFGADVFFAMRGSLQHGHQPVNSLG